ncbi:DUF4352 domain-containing protein [Priestia megaterium]|uniref:DUF4352 domain-containing protein n=1 Tax=Priestia megaterium TaxID=1404 RepID=UPI00203EA1F6|nr:DUF4352 domain-containing protein [Priestia megaterium]MCM3155565.1 DUF4352 domain-containing protein [Priestia megaterium]
MNKKFLGIIGAVVIGGGLLAGCSTSVEDASSDTGSKQEAKKEESAKDKVYKIGDTVKVDGLKITLTKAEFTSPNQYTKAENGKVLTVDVATENTGDTQAFIDNTDFNLYDKDGNKVEQYFGYDDMAISGDVNKGRKMSGKLYFDVPEQDSYEIVYTPSFSFDSTEVKFEATPQ